MLESVPRRFVELIKHPNQWVNEIEWSNDGFRSSSRDVTFLSGHVTRSHENRMHWVTDDLHLGGARVALDAWNPFSTQFRVWHGIAGEHMIPMGTYKVRQVEISDDDPTSITVRGESFECYLISNRFGIERIFKPISARALLEQLIREVFPAASIAWHEDIVDARLPSIVETDRWNLIDGDAQAPSIARALSARVCATAIGQWEVYQIPALTDPIMWEAKRGEAVLGTSESLTDEDLINQVYVIPEMVEAEEGQPPITTFAPQLAQDSDQLSPTYVGRPVDQGGIGKVPLVYKSALVTTRAQAEKVARSLLAQRLGLKQAVTLSQPHNPLIEPGDVGLVETVRGNLLVLPDSITYDLAGGPLQMGTRTTATRLTGSSYDLPAVDDGAFV